MDDDDDDDDANEDAKFDDDVRSMSLKKQRPANECRSGKHHGRRWMCVIAIRGEVIALEHDDDDDVNEDPKHPLTTWLDGDLPCVAVRAASRSHSGWVRGNRERGADTLREQYYHME